MFANLRQRFADDRGDVPGWVLITLVTVFCSHLESVHHKSCVRAAG